MVARRSQRNEPEKRRSAVIYTRFKKQGVPITDSIRRLVEDFGDIRDSLKDIEKTGMDIFTVANADRFPDKENAMKIGYSVMYINNLLSALVKELEKSCKKKDMEEFSDLINTAAFRDFLVLAAKECDRGDDSKMRGRYEILSESLRPLAERYNLKILTYDDIDKEHAGIVSTEKGVEMEKPPEEVSAKDVKEHLEANVNVKITPALEKLLKLPRKLYMRKGPTYIAFSSREDMEPIRAIQKIFNFGVSPDYKVPMDAGYGLMLFETTGRGYCLLADTSRRIAVGASVYLLQGEGERGWSDFKKALQTALKRAEKLSAKDKKTTIIVAERSSTREFNTEKD